MDNYVEQEQLMVDKRRSKEYRQLSGHIPLPLYKKFKALLTEYEISQSDALEQAIIAWVESQLIENRSDAQDIDTKGVK